MDEIVSIDLTVDEARWLVRVLEHHARWLENDAINPALTQQLCARVVDAIADTREALSA